MTEISEPKDLFGLPLRDLPSKRGRRKLVFAEEVYERVRDLRAGNMSQEEIAVVLRISVPTLVKYFGSELTEGPTLRKAEAIELLAHAARKGNVSAIKAYKAEIDKQGASAALKAREQNAPRAPAAIRMGKKEARQEEAENVVAAGGKFAPPEAPKLFN